MGLSHCSHDREILQNLPDDGTCVYLVADVWLESKIPHNLEFGNCAVNWPPSILDPNFCGEKLLQ